MSTKTYLAIADQAPGERHAIRFPAFPGVSAAAEALADLIPQARDALATAIAGVAARGEALPPAVEDGAPMMPLPAGLHNPILLMVPAPVSGDDAATLRRERDDARQSLRLLRDQYALCTELARRQTIVMHGLQQTLAQQMQRPPAAEPIPAAASPAPPTLLRRLAARVTGSPRRLRSIRWPLRP